MADDCIFCKIGAGQIPVDAIFEDDEFIAFHDQNPQAPVHVLVIPRTHFDTLMEMDDAGLMGRALIAAKNTAQSLNLHHDGFRVVINCGADGGQTVYHVHIHILGGRYMTWPPG